MPKNIKGFFKQEHAVDKIFLLLIIIVALFGLLMVYEASVVYSDIVFKSKYHYLVQQAGWMAIGFIGLFLFSRIDLNIVKKYAPYLFGISLLLLVFVLLPTPFAPAIYGARRWIYLNPPPFPAIPIVGILGFQPSELAKFAGILFLSSYLSSAKTEAKSQLVIMRNFTIILLVTAGLIAAQPDFTTAFVVVILFCSILFFNGVNIGYFLVTGPIAIGIAAIYALSSEYRRLRLMTLINPESVDSSGAGYQIKQVMIALGSGGLLGLGFGKSRQKYAYLPEVTADSIFGVVGEEFGFVGTVLLILLFILLITRGIKIAVNSEDKFARLAATGVIVWITIQVLVNLGSMVRILPITGIPLPLISYGGSSTIFILWSLGIVLNVSRKSKL